MVKGRMFRFALAILLVFICALSVEADKQEKFRIVTDSFLHLVTPDENGKAQGIAAECLIRMFNRVGRPHSLADIEFMPWSRAQKTLRETPRTVAVCMYRTREREPFFKWVGPTMIVPNGLIARKDRNIRISTPADLRAYRIGAVLGASHIQRLSDFVPLKKIDLTLVVAPGQGLQMLDFGRLDLFPVPCLGAAALMVQHGIPPLEYEVVFSLGTESMYYAFSPDTDDELIAALQTELDAIKLPGPDGRSEYDELRTEHATGSILGCGKPIVAPPP